MVELRRQFQTLFDNMAQGAFLQNADGRLVDVNPAALELFGLTREEFLGRTSYAPQWRVIDEQDQPLPPERHPSLLALATGQPVRGAVAGVFNDRRRAFVWLEIHAIPVFREGEAAPYQVLVTLHDLTEQKHLAEQQLRAARQYALLTETSLDAYWVISRAGRVMEVNEQACRMYGYTREEMLQLSLPDLEARESDSQIAAHSADIVARSHDRFETRHRRKDGTLVDVEVSTTFMADKGVFLSFVRDITERKANEALLQETRDLFGLFMKYSPIYTFIKEIDGLRSRVLELSDNYVDMVGIPAAKLRGRAMEDIFPADFARKITEDDLAVVAGGGALTLEESLNGLDYITIKFPIRREGRPSLLAGFTIDITARKRAEEALREKEQYLQTIFDASPECIKLLARDGSLLTMNRAGLDMIDAESLDRVKGQRVSSLVVDRDRPAFEALTERVFRGESCSLEFEAVGLRGRPVWLETHAVPFRDADNQITALLGLTRDVTSRKQVEAALKASEERFRSIMEEVPAIAVQGYFLDGTVHFWNRASELVYGFTAEEAMGRNLLDLIIPPEMREEVKAAVGRMAATGEPIPASELSLQRKDGSRVPVFSSHALLQHAGQPAELFCLDVDLTEQKAAREALQVSEERFRSIMALSPDIISIISQEGELLYNSPAALRVHGYTEDDLLGLNTFSLIHPDDQAEVGRVFGQLLEHPDQVHTVQYRYRNKDGSYVWMECSASNQLVNPLVRGVIAISRHIDDRVRLDEERLALEKQLLHAQKLESLGVLAGGIAHDFNNILVAILGNADLALLRLNTESPAVDHLRKIEQAAARAADLARQMLAYSGKGKFVVEGIDLNRLVEEMGHMLEVSISKKAVLRCHFTRPLPAVNADATQIRQIVMNLVINASEALGDRSGTIAVTTGRLDCTEAYLQDAWLADPIPAGPYVFLEVADTGCGMDKETLARIFDPFFTTKFTGRGLGMAAVLGIVRGHHGAIKVCSEPGKGSTFTVLLPAGERPAERLDGETGDGDRRGSGTVLLVDDEAAVRDIGAEMLKTWGFEVITATDGRDALDKYREHPGIALVVLDLTMPRMDGEQCFRELRQLDPGVKVILSSGFSEQEVTQKFAGTGLAGFVQKPYRLSALRDAVLAAQGGPQSAPGG